MVSNEREVSGMSEYVNDQEWSHISYASRHALYATQGSIYEFRRIESFSG